MKLAVIGPTYPYRGGISHFNTIFVKELCKKHDVVFISWKRMYPPLIYPSEKYDRVSDRKIITESLPILDYINPLSWREASRVIHNANPDLVILHWWHPVMSPVYRILINLIKKNSKAKIIYVCHNIFPHERFVGVHTLVKFAFKKVDYFITHYQSDKDQIRKYKPDANIISGFHPLYSLFGNLETNSEPVSKKLILRDKVILFFGIIRYYKGLEYLIRALPKILKQVDLDLMIVGTFWKKKQKQLYLNLIVSLGVDDHVIIIDNYIRNEDIRKYFEIANVVVMPYITGTQSGIIQMANAFDRPVIASRVGGFDEVIIDGKTGYLVEPCNSDQLADAVIKFYKQNRLEYFKMEIKNYKNRFSWENYIKLIPNS